MRCSYAFATSCGISVGPKATLIRGLRTMPPASSKRSSNVDINGVRYAHNLTTYVRGSTHAPDTAAGYGSGRPTSTVTSLHSEPATGIEWMPFPWSISMSQAPSTNVAVIDCQFCSFFSNLYVLPETESAYGEYDAPSTLGSRRRSRRAPSDVSARSSSGSADVDIAGSRCVHTRLRMPWRSPVPD